MNLEKLNAKYTDMKPEERVAELYNDFDKVLFTSSFGTSAAILLHMFSKINPEQTVHFIDTTYHFQETLEYRDRLKEVLNIKVEDILPAQWKNEFTKKDKTWTKDPDLCCSINKVEPLDELKPGYEVWVSGLMAYQNKERKARKIFEKSGDLLKFHPIIDFTEQQKLDYFKTNQLPEHPLQKMGYSSIGCAQCTFKGKGREGRWKGTGKSECGLHL